MRRRIFPNILLFALTSVGCTTASKTPDKEPGPMIPGTTEVRIKILDMVPLDNGFCCEYEVVEDAGNFTKGQRERSPSCGRSGRNSPGSALRNPNVSGAFSPSTRRGRSQASGRSAEARC